VRRPVARRKVTPLDEELMSRTFVVLSLFLAALVGFAAPARAQYNAPNNQFNLQRQQGGGYVLPAPAPQDTPMPQDLAQPLDTSQPQLAPSSRWTVPTRSTRDVPHADDPR
jgi:hypothetical protein